MRSKLTLFMALAMIVFATTQCTKKKTDEPVEETPPITTGANSVADIIAANGSAVNTVTVDAQLASTITINGTILEIPNNAFVTSTGGTVGGIATLQVKTILTKEEIILSGAGANSSSSKLVVTKGCVKATASQNTQSLRLNPAGGFFVNVPEPLSSPPPMKKYYAPKVTAVDSSVYWALGTDAADIALRTFPSAPSANYHHASLDSLKWLNVGVQFDSVAAPKVPVTVNVDGNKFTKSNTMIFISFNNSLTVGALFEINNGVFRVSNMPQGKGVHIIAISAINGQYFVGVQSTTISPTPINLTLNPVSQTTMKSMVAALP